MSSYDSKINRLIKMEEKTPSTCVVVDVKGHVSNQTLLCFAGNVFVTLLVKLERRQQPSEPSTNTQKVKENTLAMKQNMV